MPGSSGIYPLGVQFSCLEQLLERVKDPAATTEFVSESIIKPLTARVGAAGGAYIDLVRESRASNGLPMVGRATCFVSHAWRYPLAVVIDCLRQYLRTHPEAYFWFDLVVNNQHTAVDHDFTWWTTIFKESIGTIGDVVLVMYPWDKPMMLTRAWCLWEIHCAIDVGANIAVTIPTAEHAAFRSHVNEDSDAALLRAIVAVDAERAKAGRQQDEVRIKEAVRERVGFTALNNRVRDELRKLYLGMVKDISDNGNPNNADEYEKLGYIAQQFGKYDEALGYHTQVLALREASSTTPRPDIATAYCNIGIAYASKGDYIKAMAYHTKALSIRIATLDKNSPSLATSHSCLGVLCDQLGDFEMALEHHEQALAIFVVTLGNDHPDTAETLNSIGGAHEALGHFDKAISYYMRGLKVRVKALGRSHPDVACSYSNIGSATHCKGNYDAAIECYELALAIFKGSYGDEHPQIAAVYNNLGNTYHLKGDQDRAMECFGKALEIYNVALGEGHPTTVTCGNNVMQCFHAKMAQMHGGPQAGSQARQQRTGARGGHCLCAIC